MRSPAPALDHPGTEGAHEAMGPAHVDPEHLFEILWCGLEGAPGLDPRRVRHQHLHRPERVLSLLGEGRDGRRVGQVEVEGGGGTALGPDARRELLAGRVRRAPSTTGWPAWASAARRGGADPRRRPGHDRGPAFWRILEARHQRCQRRGVTPRPSPRASPWWAARRSRAR